jgi:exodeoxyribonuclease-5
MNNNLITVDFTRPRVPARGGAGHGIVLTAEQQAAATAIEDFLNFGLGRVFTVFGLAGTGKTTLLAEIARRYPSALVCAPTGKAAAALRERFGRPAGTIHSAFYRLKGTARDARGREVKEFALRHRDGAMANKLVLLDEASMIDAAMVEQLLGLGVTIIAFGDPGQLPPVSGKPGFLRADYELTEIHRQARDSPIIRQAHAVRAGGHYQPDDDAFRVVRRDCPDNLRQADMVLCHRNTTRQYLNQQCRYVRGVVPDRARLDGRFDPTTAYPRQWEPVVVLRNVRQYDLWNGDIGLLDDDVRPGDTTVTLFRVSESGGSAGGVRFPLASFEGMPEVGGAAGGLELAFGYCLTTHKAEGSEWRSVLIYDEISGTDGECRAWRYTALTRAIERVVIVNGSYQNGR